MSVLKPTGVLFGRSFLARATLKHLARGEDEVVDAAWSGRPQQRVVLGLAPPDAGKVESTLLATRLLKFDLGSLFTFNYADAINSSNAPAGTYVVPYWFADLELRGREGQGTPSSVLHRHSITAGPVVTQLRRALDKTDVHYVFDGGVGSADCEAHKAENSVKAHYRDSICYGVASAAKTRDTSFAALLRIYPAHGMSFPEAQRFHDETSKIFAVVLHHLIETG